MNCDYEWTFTRVADNYSNDKSSQLTFEILKPNMLKKGSGAPLEHTVFKSFVHPKELLQFTIIKIIQKNSNETVMFHPFLFDKFFLGLDRGYTRKVSESSNECKTVSTQKFSGFSSVF